MCDAEWQIIIFREIKNTTHLTMLTQDKELRKIEGLYSQTKNYSKLLLVGAGQYSSFM